ncbi:putative FAD/NAD(P)-binding domain-containing protein [Seiridium unicorne]|uniref:FAD/NAD(P)-binding domain-containing protein n=1 Tax=Seiridium unicorne TaxID=138068 RepID=A0ABR2UKB5_9PEZI
MEAEKFDVVVVGTGWNGLICAKTYLELSPTANLVLIDEGSSIGGVWSTERIYPTLYAQIKYGQFEYSCYPMRREGITTDGYISGETSNKYLNEFAHKFDLIRRTRLQTRVHEVVRIPGSGWRLQIEGVGKRAVECEKLVYASGATSHAVIPSWPKSPDFDVPTIHSHDTGKHLDELANIQRAIVVGAAKSAFDTVFLLLDAGKQVDWVIREDGSGPVALMPPTLGGLVNTMEISATRWLAVLGASIMNTQGSGYKFVHRTRLGRMLTRQFWRILNLVADKHAGYSKSPNAANLRPIPNGEGVFWATAGLGAASVPDYWKVFHAGDCTVHRTEIKSLAKNAVHLANGAHLQTDYIILCTGFDKSYHPFGPELQRECGLSPPQDSSDRKKWDSLEAQAEETVDELLPVLRRPPLDVRGLTTINSDSTSESLGGGQKPEAPSHGPSRHYRRLIVPGLAAQGDRSIIFPGFIHSIYTPLVSETQALWGCAFLLGLHDAPTRLEMEKEVAVWNVWTRKRYPAQGQKHAYAIYDFLSYIDTLLGDLGINTRRDPNPFTNFFMPVYPRAYRGLVGEFWQAHARKRDGKHAADTAQTSAHARRSTVAGVLALAVFALLFVAISPGSSKLLV